MQIVFNHQPRELPEGASLQTLFDEIAPKEPNIAMVLNFRIINRAKWAETALNDGDKVTMFEMVAGG